MAKNLLAMQEIWVRPLYKGMAILAIPQYSCLGNSVDRGAWRGTVTEVDTTEQLTHFTSKQTFQVDKSKDSTTGKKTAPK